MSCSHYCPNFLFGSPNVIIGAIVDGVRLRIIRNKGSFLTLLTFFFRISHLQNKTVRRAIL